jgi:hypothetical protein
MAGFCCDSDGFSSLRQGKVITSTVQGISCNDVKVKACYCLALIENGDENALFPVKRFRRL